MPIKLDDYKALKSRVSQEESAGGSVDSRKLQEYSDAITQDNAVGRSKQTDFNVAALSRVSPEDAESADAYTTASSIEEAIALGRTKNIVLNGTKYSQVPSVELVDKPGKYDKYNNFLYKKEGEDGLYAITEGKDKAYSFVEAKVDKDTEGDWRVFYKQGDTFQPGGFLEKLDPEYIQYRQEKEWYDTVSKQAGDIYKSYADFAQEFGAGQGGKQGLYVFSGNNYPNGTRKWLWHIPTQQSVFLEQLDPGFRQYVEQGPSYLKQITSFKAPDDFKYVTGSSESGFSFKPGPVKKAASTKRS